MHSCTTRRVAIDQHISAGRGTIVVKVMQRDAIGDPRGWRLAVFNRGVEQRERHLNPLAYRIWSPVKCLLC